MFCKQCGKEIADGAKFCASCGAPAGPSTTISAAVTDDGKVVSFDDYIAYQNLKEEQARLEQDIANTRNSIAYYKEVYRKAKKRLIAMPAVGFFFALTVAPSIVENDISRSGASASYAPLEMLIVTTFFTVLFSVVMFGLAFLKDKAVESGYWVFGGWVIMLCLFMLVLFAAVFVGIPHFVGLINKKRDARKQIDLAEKRLQTLMA